MRTRVEEERARRVWSITLPRWNRRQIRLLLVVPVLALLLASGVPPSALAGVTASVPTVTSSRSANLLYAPLVTMPPDNKATTRSAGQLRFGVYPGGGTGETPGIPNPDMSVVTQRLTELSSGRSFQVHLYTAWSWYDPAALDDQVRRFGNAGLGIVLSVKYSPPPGHVGDIAGYEAFVRSLVSRYAANPALASFVIGNEANVYGNPDASDGPFAGSEMAVVRGVVAARREVARRRSSARVGFNFALTSSHGDAAFIQDLARKGGPEFVSAVQFVGIDMYPGIWPPGTGQFYTDMANGLESARVSVDSVAGLRGLPLDVLEVGAPILDENEQADRLSAFVRAVADRRERLQISSFSWFDLWDANSSARSNPYAHYGLLRSDLTPKPAFAIYKSLVAANG